MKKLTLTIVIMATAFSLNAQSPWTRKADMDTIRIGQTPMVYNGKLYVFGGDTEYNIAIDGLTQSEVYDPVLDSWSPLADLDTANASASACIVNDKIWLFGGGKQVRWFQSESIKQYDPATDTWEWAGSLPPARARMAHGSFLWENKIYLVGGGPNAGLLDPYPKMDIYDLVTGTWTQGAEQPHPMKFFASAFLNGKFYHIGGEGSGSTTNNKYPGTPAVEVYDPSTDTWSEAAPMNISRKLFKGCTMNDKIYVWGGAVGDETASMASGEVYDPETDTWKMIADMPVELVFHSVSALNGKIYVCGGSQTPPPITPVKSLYEYDPSLDLRPYVRYTEVDKIFARAGFDTILISTKMADPTGMTLWAVMKITDQVPVDSVQLFDDGMHNDGEAGDSLYANIWQVVAKDHWYDVALHATRITDDTLVHHMNKMAVFTSVGPLVFDECHFTSDDDTLNPGDNLKFKVNIRNNGTTGTAKNLRFWLSTPSSHAKLTGNNLKFKLDSIASGETGESNTFYIWAYEDCPVNTEIPLELKIYGNDNIFYSDYTNDYLIWTDTFSITVYEAPDILKQIYEPQITIYPNPAKDQLTLEFDKTGCQINSIVLYDITGKVIYSEQLDQRVSAPYTINLSSIGEGLYFLHISNDRYSVTEKVIKVE